MAALLLEIKQQGLHSLEGKFSWPRVLLLLATATQGCRAGTNPEKQREGRHSAISPPPTSLPASHTDSSPPAVPQNAEMEEIPWISEVGKDRQAHHGQPSPTPTPLPTHMVTEVGEDPSGHHVQPNPSPPYPPSMPLNRSTEPLGLQKTSRTTQCIPTHPTLPNRSTEVGTDRSDPNSSPQPPPHIPKCHISAILHVMTSPLHFQHTSALLEQKYFLISNLETKPQRGEPTSEQGWGAQLCCRFSSCSQQRGTQGAGRGWEPM